MTSALKHYNNPVKWHLKLYMANRSGEKKTRKIKTISAMRIADVEEEMVKEFHSTCDMIKLLTPDLFFTYSIEIDDKDWELAKATYQETDEYKTQAAIDKKWEIAMNALSIIAFILITVGAYAEFTCQPYSLQLLRECSSKGR
ncbi:hypothetical protein N8506_01945 [Synechococcus sp. AH-601-N23]|nr:hypothetical protein [Synechococcus sp. AH-601-N23]